jgi:thiamine-phosphate diphosphorylase
MPLKEARKILGNKKIIGISTHTVKQAIRAEEEGADYIGFGPIFHTSTKDAGRPRGLKMLEEVRDSIKIPIAAIGGISSGSVCDIINEGADAAAVGSAILSGDVSNNIKTFLSLIRECS